MISSIIKQRATYTLPSELQIEKNSQLSFQHCGYQLSSVLGFASSTSVIWQEIKFPLMIQRRHSPCAFPAAFLELVSTLVTHSLHHCRRCDTWYAQLELDSNYKAVFFLILPSSPNTLPLMTVREECIHNPVLEKLYLLTSNKASLSFLEHYLAISKYVDETMGSFLFLKYS